ncbi:DinB family protein [Actinoplanes sp. NPDC020271]|uniref:DinB family protein n=1 Tax=Actinoplanes sp. NPDC020271 TaxID=3363896 RepID=UPI0037B1A55A
MTEFINQDFSGAWFRNGWFEGARFRGAYLVDAEIDGEIRGLRVNGVEVAPLVEAELNRRYPERVKMKPVDADGFREAYAILERLWAGTVERARALPPELLHERVDGEFSFIETLRHLVFVTDAWVLRAVLGDPSPYWSSGLPHDEMPAMPGVIPADRSARPSLDEVLVVRRERAVAVRQLLEDFDFDGVTTPVDAPGYPPPAAYPLRRCLGAIVNEEWEHRLFAERDLDALTGR